MLVRLPSTISELQNNSLSNGVCREQNTTISVAGLGLRFFLKNARTHSLSVREYMDFQVVVLAGGFSKTLVPLVSKVFFHSTFVG